MQFPFLLSSSLLTQVSKLVAYINTAGERTPMALTTRLLRQPYATALAVNRFQSSNINCMFLAQSDAMVEMTTLIGASLVGISSCLPGRVWPSCLQSCCSLKFKLGSREGTLPYQV